MAFMSGNYIDEWQNGVCIGCPGAPVPITVGAAQVVAGIDFSLAAGGTITGTIFCDTQSLPTAFEHAPGVAAFSSTGQLVQRSPEPLHCARADLRQLHNQWTADRDVLPVGSRHAG